MMTRLEKRMKKLRKQLDIFCNKILNPLIDALNPILEIFIDAFNPLVDILKHECYRCLDNETCELQDLDFPITNCKYFVEIGELKLIEE